MAKSDSIFKIKGLIDGMSFYEMNGKIVVRRSNPPTKEKIMKDKRFKRLAENMAEFGGGGKISKDIRQMFMPYSKLYADSYIHGRLTGLIRKIISKGQGKRGERSFELSKNKKMPEGFEFNKNKAFSAVVKSTDFNISINENRDKVSLSISGFKPRNMLVIPKGATHFKFVLCCGVFERLFL